MGNVAWLIKDAKSEKGCIISLNCPLITFEKVWCEAYVHS